MIRPNAHRARAWRLVAALVIFVTASAACSDDTDEQSPPESPPDEAVSRPQMGVDVAVVLPPRSSTAAPSLAAVERDVEELDAANPPGLRSVRTLIPERSVFVRDLAEFAGQQDADLICVLGTGGAAIVEQLHVLQPASRHCAVVPGPTGEPPASDVDLLVLRSAELGYAIGAVAAALPGDGVAVVTDAGDLEGEGFRDGVGAALANTPTATIDPDIDPSSSVDDMIASDIGVLIVGSGTRSVELAAAAQDAGMSVVGPASVADAASGTGFSVTWDVRWGRVLQPSVDRLLGRDEPAGLSMGFADGVFDVRVTDGSATVAGMLEEIIDEFVRGVRDPLEAPEVVDDRGPQESDGDGDDGDDGDGDGDGDGDEDESDRDENDDADNGESVGGPGDPSTSALSGRPGAALRGGRP